VPEAGRGSPQANVIAAGGVITGNVAGFMVIVLVTGVRSLPQASVAVQVSVTVPPQASGGIADKVEKFEFPLMRHPPDNPLVKAILVATGSAAPHALVIATGAVIEGNVAGLTVIVRETGVKTLPQGSVAVHVSVTVPPQAPGVAVKVERFEFPLIRHPTASELV